MAQNHYGNYQFGSYGKCLDLLQEVINHINTKYELKQNKSDVDYAAWRLELENLYKLKKLIEAASSEAEEEHAEVVKRSGIMPSEEPPLGLDLTDHEAVEDLKKNQPDNL